MAFMTLPDFFVSGSPYISARITVPGNYPLRKKTDIFGIAEQDQCHLIRHQSQTSLCGFMGLCDTGPAFVARVPGKRRHW
jgi:hypothetical protein